MLGAKHWQADPVLQRDWPKYQRKSSNEHKILEPLQKFDCNTIFPNELTDLLGMELFKL